MMFLQELSRTRPDLDDRYVPNVQNARTPSEDLQRAFDQLNPSWNGPEHLKPEAARIERCDNPGCTWCGTHK
jgi:hypothetical protein